METADAVLRTLESAFPRHWRLRRRMEPDGTSRPDAIMRLEMGEGTAEVRLEVRNSVTPRDVPMLADRRHGADPDALNVIAAPYLGKPAREALRKAGLSYADATGNAWLFSDHMPHLLISLSGSNRDPWREPGRPKAGLKGRPAAAVVRLLADTFGPWSATTLAADAGVAVGSVYRVVEVLDELALIDRTDGAVRVPDRFALLDAWCQDYEFLTTNRIHRFVAKRGVAAFLGRLAFDDRPDLTVTGTLALPDAARTVPATTVMAYAHDPASIAERFDLVPSDRAANVVLAVPAYPTLTSRAERVDGLLAVALSQAYADLMTSGGRGPSEAEHLRAWIELAGG